MTDTDIKADVKAFKESKVNLSVHIHSDGVFYSIPVHVLDDYCEDAVNLITHIEQLEKEIEILRQYGNKDCTAMADEALTTLESK